MDSKCTSSLVTIHHRYVSYSLEDRSCHRVDQEDPSTIVVQDKVQRGPSPELLPPVVPLTKNCFVRVLVVDTSFPSVILTRLPFHPDVESEYFPESTGVPFGTLTLPGPLNRTQLSSPDPWKSTSFPLKVCHDCQLVVWAVVKVVYHLIQEGMSGPLDPPYSVVGDLIWET